MDYERKSRRRDRSHRGAEAPPPRALDRDRALARRAGRAVLRGHAGQGTGGADPPVVKHMTETTNQPRRTRRDMIVAASCGVFVAAMVGMAYAAVPFYDWFCRATGFGGRTQVATSAPQAPAGRTISVRFDANVTGGLPWRFEPEQNAIQAKLGEVVTV